MTRPGHYEARAHQYELDRAQAVAAKREAAEMMARLKSNFVNLMSDVYRPQNFRPAYAQNPTLSGRR